MLMLNIKSLSDNPILRSHFVCVVCRDNLAISTDQDSIEAESSFHFQEEHVQDISLEDPGSIFKQKGLHFIHLNVIVCLVKLKN